jgi:hypothetical protein
MVAGGIVNEAGFARYTPIAFGTMELVSEALARRRVVGLVLSVFMLSNGSSATQRCGVAARMMLMSASDSVISFASLAVDQCVVCTLTCTHSMISRGNRERLHSVWVAIQVSVFCRRMHTGFISSSTNGSTAKSGVSAVMGVVFTLLTIELVFLLLCVFLALVSLEEAEKPTGLLLLMVFALLLLFMVLALPLLLPFGGSQVFVVLVMLGLVRSSAHDTGASCVTSVVMTSAVFLIGIGAIVVTRSISGSFALKSLMLTQAGTALMLVMLVLGKAHSACHCAGACNGVSASVIVAM